MRSSCCNCCLFFLINQSCTRAPFTIMLSRFSGKFINDAAINSLLLLNCCLFSASSPSCDLLRLQQGNRLLGESLSQDNAFFPCPILHTLPVGYWFYIFRFPANRSQTSSDFCLITFTWLSAWLWRHNPFITEINSEAVFPYRPEGNHLVPPAIYARCRWWCCLSPVNVVSVLWWAVFPAR